MRSTRSFWKWSVKNGEVEIRVTWLRLAFKVMQSLLTFIGVLPSNKVLYNGSAVTKRCFISSHSTDCSLFWVAPTGSGPHSPTAGFKINKWCFDIVYQFLDCTNWRVGETANPLPGLLKSTLAKLTKTFLKKSLIIYNMAFSQHQCFLVKLIRRRLKNTTLQHLWSNNLHTPLSFATCLWALTCWL